MLHFTEFVDKRGREAKKQLDILKRVMERQGLIVGDYLDDEDPYLFVQSDRDLTFEGVRVYKIGDSIAYRVQKEKNTHPYGKAYPLDVEEMYSDIVSDDMDEDKAGKKVMEAVGKEISKFFEKTGKAECDLRRIEGTKLAMVRNGAWDNYSAPVIVNNGL
jgi:hypothetical protein